MKKLNKRRILQSVFLLALFAMMVLVVAVMIQGDGGKEKKVYKMILVPKTIDKTNGFWTSLIAGSELGADGFAVDLKVVGGTSEEDIDAQIAWIEESIKEKPDVMLVAPCSYSQTTNVLQKVVNNDIKLILIDSVIDKDIADGIVSTDNYLAGKDLGEYAQTLLTDSMEIGVVAHVKGASTAIEREKGMRDGLGKFEPQIKDVVFCGSSYERAYEQTLEMLKKYPEMRMIMGTNEYGAVGAARAIKDLGLIGQVKVVGFDNSVEEIQLLEEGVFQGIVIQKPFNIGYLGIQQAVSAASGKKLQKDLDSGCKLITKENMYEEENQRLLYPFTGQQ